MRSVSPSVKSCGSKDVSILRIIEFVKKTRNVSTVILALSGIVMMFYYDYCDAMCSYLQGAIWGINLKWVGIVYMFAIIAFAACRQFSFVRILLAAGLGVEVFLFSFQVQNSVFCPFCLFFALAVISAFIVNYEVPSAWRENRRKMWLFFLGEVDLPIFRIHKLPLLFVGILGYFIVLFTFSGSVLPAYGQNTTSTFPSPDRGTCEVILFTDYFCPPCRVIDAKAEPVIKELLAQGNVKITYVDVPVSRATPTYAKYLP